MSTFGSPQTLSKAQVLPPDRGSFPLDHDGECKHLVTQYLECLRSNYKNKYDDSNATNKCRDLSRLYIECRMSRGLMAKDDLSNLGFHGDEK